MNAYSFPEGREPAHEHDSDQIRISKPVLYMMIALVAFSIVTIAAGRMFQVGVTHEGTLHPVRSVDFTVAGSQGGALVVTRADGFRVQLAAPGEEIFPRLILRSVANIRTRDGVPLSAPLILDVMPDGQRLIVDPATHRTLRLAAFGPENGAMLDPLLAKGSAQ